MEAAPRRCVARVSVVSGVPWRDLTTAADLYPGPYGLPDAPPYNETIMLAPHVPHNSDSERAWRAHTWREYRSRS